MSKQPDYKIVFIGAGNLATQLSIALQQSGCSILQVFSRTETSASVLAEKLKVPYTTSLQKINPDADLYIFSVKDSAITDCLNQMKPVKGLVVHTAGSVSMSVFDSYTSRSGVLYPLQTFSKNRTLSFEKIPFFIEANYIEDENILKEIAGKISRNTNVLPSDKRKYIHLSAVFACNFTNHIYDLASQILAEQNLPFECLLPLIEETAAKVQSLSPHEAQTGPAVRYDENVINSQINLLTDDYKKNLYKMISKGITEKFR